jgi:hypothetical protein
VSLDFSNQMLLYGSSPNVYLIIARVFIAFFATFAQRLKHTHCRICHKIVWGQIHVSK